MFSLYYCPSKQITQLKDKTEIQQTIQINSLSLIQPSFMQNYGLIIPERNRFNKINLN